MKSSAAELESASGRRAFWLRWVAANSIGEALGLGAVALAGYLVVHHLTEPATLPGRLAWASLFVAFGAFEGAVVGWFQASVLASALPELSRWAWTRRTIFGAVAAWALGMAPSAVIGLLEVPGATAGPPAPGMPLPLEMLLACALGLVAGPLLAAFQAPLLSAATGGKAWWLKANALAWAAGMPLIFLVADRVPTGAGVATIAGLVFATLLVTGALVGAVHGAFLVQRLGSSVLRSGH
ncbi:MAG TPA: hypothetical protein VF017_09585 [Thermoanaerobaculia bacterium]|nr:hypothetical protein [Thermoanaerobaculia bacterium]